MLLLLLRKFIAVTLFFMCLALSHVSYASNSYTVKSTDSLSKVVDKFYKGSQLSRYQIYIGILAENPDAFRLGNINYLKNGQLLKLPDPDSLLAMEKDDAANLIAEHNDNARLRNKVKIAPPFEVSSLELEEISSLTEKQHKTNEELEELVSESEALRIRMDQLLADKEAMDAELVQLDSLLKQ